MLCNDGTNIVNNFLNVYSTFISWKRGHLDPWKWNGYSLPKSQQQTSPCCVPIQKGAELKCVASKARNRDGVLSVLIRLRYHGSLLWRGKSLISVSTPALGPTRRSSQWAHRERFLWGKAAGKLITHIRPVSRLRTSAAVHPLTHIQ